MPKKQLLCWDEHGVSRSDDKAEATNLVSRNNESCQDIVHLQDLSVGRKRGAGGGLLAVYADGYVRCFSPDLQEEKWEFNPPSVNGRKKDTKVVYAASTTLAMARKALLKDRMDILPEPISEDDTPEDTVLFTVSRCKYTFEVRIFTIPAINQNTKKPRELLVLTLPGSPSEKGSASDSSVFSIHFPTATLHSLSAEKLTTYSLISTIPSISSSLCLTSSSSTDPVSSSLLRVSPSTVLIATNEHVSLYDTKFTSLQARVPIQTTSTSSTPTASRSSTPASMAGGKFQGTVFLTAYLSQLDLAIGYSQNGIIAIQLSRGLKEKGRKSGLLIDSLCCGLDGLEIPKVDNSKTKKATGDATMKKILNKLSLEKTRLATTMAKLQEARREEDLKNFESAFAEYAGIKRTSLPAPALEDTAMVNGTNLETPNKQLPEFVAKTVHKPLSHEFVTAVLAHIFTPSTNVDGDAILTINFYPPNVIKYLAESGNLSSMLLPRNTTSTLVSSLATFDPSLRILEWVLSTISAISAPEVVSAIAAALVKKTPGDANGDGGDGDDDDDGITPKLTYSKVLRLALVRLDSFPAPVVIASLNSGLSGEDLMTLISLLRRELSVHDTNNPHPDEETAVSISDIGIVSSLLTTALDSIGIGGLVLMDDTDGLIAGLYEEVGDAVGAIEEAAELKGILEEMFRHADWRRMAIERRDTKQKSNESKRLEVRGKNPDADDGKNEVVVPAVEKDAATTSLSKPTDKEAATSRCSTDIHKARRKARYAHADPDSRAAINARLRTRRKLHKLLHKRNSQGNTVNALLPLGLAPPPPSSLPNMGLTWRGLVGSGMDTEAEKREMERKRGREANYRKSLVAGVYSVESIVV